MKKTILIFAAAALFLSACTEQVPMACTDVEADEVKAWIRDHQKNAIQNDIQNHETQNKIMWIGTAVYKGETIFYANRYGDGIIFCGTGLSFDDMYVAFDCKGKPLQGINWNQLDEFGELYSDFGPLVEEEKDPS